MMYSCFNFPNNKLTEGVYIQKPEPHLYPFRDGRRVGISPGMSGWETRFPNWLNDHNMKYRDGSRVFLLAECVLPEISGWEASFPIG
jgi:hypothetical protein